ncbi:hypothetical protein ATI61_11366 [Archangium gephyra]|uniref:Uncharacterized protein n=1 Tax=Archangium gephyra TaxID=48 RepID=A0AAC8TEI0_9BACT|nr:hypothetical protein [Archangium gephyra]AKJ02877.1 Hypothetical protein AA314_04503 [Archangium gephyra]REG25003.1 hypothetical protein ATI61_11366 [Archangium gephyra]
MRTALPLQARTPALSREKAPPPVDPRGFGSRGFSERPPSIREAIIRWLNEEL